MKSISSPLQSHFGLDSMTLTYLWKVTRLDGTVLGFTTHDEDIVYGGTTYLAGSGMTNTATSNKSDLSVDNAEVTAFLDSDSIQEADIRAGLYNYSTVEIFVVNWADLTMGDMKVKSGTVGEIKMKNGVFTGEIRGLTQYLSTNIGSLYGPLCRAELGAAPPHGGYPPFPGIDKDSHWFCYVDLSLYRQNGSVSSSPDAVTIVPNSGLTMRGSTTPSNPAPAGWFNDGILIFTSGPMNNFTLEVKNWDGTTLTMFLPMQYQPNPSDTFTIEPGCNKLAGPGGDCFAKFNNIVNHRGEPKIPGNDLILLYPDAK